MLRNKPGLLRNELEQFKYLSHIGTYSVTLTPL